ncbi:SIR2 family protein [Agrobacterium larrymoorei]|uniref:SIR2 family protein n=1 Tax=Agrobacterium larrymoorei TaxID=160699 RepID=A0AAF0HA95_9HYPH|nr:SIR2 family protein [Agrobacterium larrymoorei]WHA41917.1 SIR2 family protein [Agrobacterium larrymoorei]
MVDITDSLTKALHNSGSAPFLFVGSGFSRRYIGLETWSDLLARFCRNIREYGFYLSNADGDLPRTASHIAKDFNPMWWEHPDYEHSKREYEKDATEQSASLKFEIAKYLRGLSLEYKDKGLANEIKVLAQMNVDGIITTNWDLLLEDLFPDYKVFIGQEELIFSNPQSIAEIYKIHGCSSRPSSLILTEVDYKDFQKKNPYLAAKLITIFVEHPVIFLGYSINDPHIQAIIGSIAECVGGEKLKQFEDNLIFVERPGEGEEDAFEGATITIGASKVRVTLVRTNDFSKIYAAVEATKRKIPARVLRYCKEQMYELVKSTDPEVKLAVRDLDDIGEKDDIEFVVGVGVAKEFKKREESVTEKQKEILTARGYTGINVDDVFDDILREKTLYQANEILKSTYPLFKKLSNANIPAFRYLREAGIVNGDSFQKCDYADARLVANRTLKRGFTTNGYRAQFDRDFKGLTTQEIIDRTTPEKASLMLPFQPKSEIDLAVLGQFLKDNSDRLKEGSYRSFFKKLACMYDYLAFGFEV